MIVISCSYTKVIHKIILSAPHSNPESYDKCPTATLHLKARASGSTHTVPLLEARTGQDPKSRASSTVQASVMF